LLAAARRWVREAIRISAKTLAAHVGQYPWLMHIWDSGAIVITQRLPLRIFLQEQH